MLWATFWRTVYTGKLANDMWYVTETLITYLSLFSRTRKDKLLYKDSARPEYVTETLITYLSVFYRTRKDTLLYKDCACHDWKHTYSHTPSTRLDSIWGPAGGREGRGKICPQCTPILFDLQGLNLPIWHDNTTMGGQAPYQSKAVSHQNVRTNVYHTSFYARLWIKE